MTTHLTITDGLWNNGESVGTLVGIDDDDNFVRIACDWRQCVDILEALAAGEEVEVFDVEDWQILSVTPQPKEATP